MKREDKQWGRERKRAGVLEGKGKYKKEHGYRNHSQTGIMGL